MGLLLQLHRPAVVEPICCNGNCQQGDGCPMFRPKPLPWLSDAALARMLAEHTIEPPERRPGLLARIVSFFWSKA